MIDASTTITTGIRRTLIQIDSTVGTGKTRRTLAQKPIHPIDTLASVVARLWNTIVDVLLTVVPLKTLPAYAFVVVTSVDASAAILARIRSARHLLGNVTGGALPFWGASADEHIAQILTGAAVLTCRVVAMAVL